MSAALRGQVWAIVVAALWCGAANASAQLQSGTIEGTVLGPDGRLVQDATVQLLDALGAPIVSTTAPDGTFTLARVAPGTYTIRAELPPLLAVMPHIIIASAVPVRVTMRLSPSAAEQVTVSAPDAGPPGTTTRVTVGGDAVRRAPARLRVRGVQDAIAAVAGWSTEDNGLLHVRGVDDGFLYVIDGVPVYERLDARFGMAPDPDTIDSLNVVTGYIPPEFGWKAGGVIEVRSALRPAARWAGTLEAGLGTDANRTVSAFSGGPTGRHAAVTVWGSAQESARFLDPVHPDNLHNDGGSWNGSGQFSWSAPGGDLLTVVGGWSRAAFQVPHADAQEEAGQDQRQRLRHGSITGTWQRPLGAATVSQVSAFGRTGASTLTGSPRDTPLFTDADRALHRVGLLASVAHQHGRHLLKAGAEAGWLRLREGFTFAVTDPAEAEDAGLSDAALEYGRGNPFRFTGAARPRLHSLYVQDSIRASAALTVDAGVRFDWSRQLTQAFQASPRIGAAYRMDRARTILRASAGRFLQPPQPENLLLSSSEQAWDLSPFRGETGGGAPLQPERQTAIEAGVERALPGGLRLDAAAWQRWIRHVADPNVFFGTTILFPNSVAEGRAHGIDLRLELPRRRGVSGFVSYAHARVVQFGPILGGLFLEDEVIEIGPGTRFTPDHDQRHVASFGASYDRPRWWLSFTGRYESGTPLEVDEDELDELRGRPGAQLVDFDRGRVKPRAVVDVSGARQVVRRGALGMSLRASLLNLTGRRWAYNFGNPFSGTHFGPGRTFMVSARVNLR